MATAPMHLSDYDPSKVPSGRALKITLVVSEWNAEITEGLYQGAFETLTAHEVSPSHIQRINVPGSFELVHGCRLAQKKSDVVIAVGSVIQGETKHFDFVCLGVTQGIVQLNTQSEVPVIFCVLTDTTLAQAQARSGGKYGNKGVEAAVAALKMAALHRS
tara:strand:- start:11 stop:490 length:480 start_codon:yes stop_codon:yes gene_type:complete